MNGISRIALDYPNITWRVDVEPTATAFLQAAEDLDLTRDELALAVAQKLGFVAENIRQGESPDAADVKAANGVLYLLGLVEGRFGERRDKIVAGQSSRIGLALREIEDDLDL